MILLSLVREMWSQKAVKATATVFKINIICSTLTWQIDHYNMKRTSQRTNGRMNLSVTYSLEWWGFSQLKIKNLELFKRTLLLLAHTHEQCRNAINILNMCLWWNKVHPGWLVTTQPSIPDHLSNCVLEVKWYFFFQWTDKYERGKSWAI